MYIQRNKSWSKAKSQNYNGRHYDSGFEAGQAMELTMLQKAGKIKSFEAHEPIDLICNGYKVGTYQIDFTVHHLDGSIEYQETKGWATDVWKLKWKIFCSMFESNPNIKLTLIKQNNNWGMRKIKKSY